MYSGTATEFPAGPDNLLLEPFLEPFLDPVEGSRAVSVATGTMTA